MECGICHQGKLATCKEGLKCGKCSAYYLTRQEPQSLPDGWYIDHDGIDPEGVSIYIGKQNEPLRRNGNR